MGGRSRCAKCEVKYKTTTNGRVNWHSGFVGNSGESCCFYHF